MTDPLYYNILRHSGGSITLLRMYELTKDPKYLKSADKSLEFLLAHIQSHKYKGNTAYYVFYNKKSKLGGTGVALTAFMRYYMLTKDPKYNRYIFGMVRHLLSRITEDGEMIGYYIHPLFNDSSPILNPSTTEKKQLFSFYYPGEALLGLALFEREMDLETMFRKEIRTASKKALDFLVNVRPHKYRERFLPLPADGWLMQAIEEWAGDTEFQKKEYLDFVFNDAKQMISHMYKPKNSPYFDYPGTFYYVYGNHCYPDGARAEGLFAAYALAKKTGKNELAGYFLRYCKIAAQSLLFTYNSRESTFMHKYPYKSIGSFRFKFTRQWMRIDSVQHTACFFVRLYSEL